MNVLSVLALDNIKEGGIQLWWRLQLIFQKEEHTSYKNENDRKIIDFRNFNIFVFMWYLN